MTAATEQLVESLESLTLHSYKAFCEDITSMFGNGAECSADSTGQGSLSDLKKDFKKLASVNQVQAKGVLEGSFHLLLDQAGLFILAGVFVMLPEKRILENIRGGTLRDADYINDAIKEVGNLLIGSWDRIFREEQEGHKHFKQTGTFVGLLWDNPKESIGLDSNQSCRYAICRIKIDDFPEFKCAAVFSEQLFETPAETLETPDVETVDTAESLPISTDAQPSAEINESQTSPPAQAEPIEDAKQSEPAGEEHALGPITEAISQLTKQTDTAAGVSDNSVSANIPTLSAGQVMNPTVLWIDPEETVENVLRQMQQHNIGYALAGRDGQIEGLVSRSDIAAAISPYTRPAFAHWRRPQDDATLQIRIKWFMSRPVHTISPNATLTDVMTTMLRYSVRGLPVADSNGQLMGIVTAYDVFTAILKGAGIGVTGRPQQAPGGSQ